MIFSLFVSIDFGKDVRKSRLDELSILVRISQNPDQNGNLVRISQNPDQNGNPKMTTKSLPGGPQQSIGNIMHGNKKNSAVVASPKNLHFFGGIKL